MEKHVLALYFYSVLAGFGLTLYVSVWMERQGGAIGRSVLTGVGTALAMAVLGPYTFIVLLRDLIEEQRAHPATMLACLAAANVLPLTFTVWRPSQANIAYCAITIVLNFALALYAAKKN